MVSGGGGGGSGSGCGEGDGLQCVREGVSFPGVYVWKGAGFASTCVLACPCGVPSA